MTLTPISSLESARKNFSWTRRTSCLESSNRTFLGSGGRNDSNTHQFGRISEKKNFYELDVHHVWKVGIKRFSAHEAEMTLTHISSLESGRKNFSWTRSTSCLESGNQTFLGSGGRNDSNTHQFARIGEKKLLMSSRYIMSRKWESHVFRLRRPKWL